MEAITNPAALELSEEIKKAAAPDGFISGTLIKKSEWEQLKNYFMKQKQKAT